MRRGSLLWLVLLTGCPASSGGIGDRCGDTADCSSQLQCIAGACAPLCVRAPDCGAGYACDSSGYCDVSTAEVGEPCTSEVDCEAGLACARIARQCLKWGLGPADFFAGIPGTLGGALAMNAGAFGGETWRHVLEVETIDRHGHVRTRAVSEFKVSYRHVVPPAAEEWFVAAKLTFERSKAVNDAKVRELLEKRKASQPIGEWSCGSVFTNPPNDHAARLIDTAGLKGYRIGGASVSDKHANFIINHGQATAADLERLIHHVQETVQRVHGIRLNPEVRVVGEAA